MVENIKIKVDKLHVWFGAVYALRCVSLEIFEQEILSIIGPSSSGKSSFLRCLNRLNDLDIKFKHEGKILIDGSDLYGRTDVNLLRKKIGMVFALPMPLPLSIFENVAYGPQMHGIKNRNRLSEIVERSLREAYLWDEVKDRLQSPAMKLSGGQQQRLCIARTLALEPDIILYDEPCSGLDPLSTAKIEEAMFQFKDRYTQILVTNNTKQAARVGDRTAFFLMGELVEIDETGKIFTSPSDRRTNDYIAGRFG